MGKNLIFTTLALVLYSTSLEAQEVYPRRMNLPIQAWPDSVFSCLETGVRIPVLEEFADGSAEITPRMEAEIRALQTQMEDYMRREPDYCFKPIGAANTTLWNGVPRGRRDVHQGNDALVSLKRSYNVGSMLHLAPFSIAPGRVRHDILSAELPKSTVIAFGKFYKGDARGKEVDTSDLRNLISSLSLRVDNQNIRLDSLEQRLKEIENRPLPKVRDIFFSFSSGGGFDVNSGYNMPVAVASLLVGTSEKWHIDVTAWAGASPNQGSTTFERLDVVDGRLDTMSLSSKLLRWGHGTRLALKPGIPCGPMIERFKYEVLVREVGEFSETKRGFALGASCDLDVGRLKLGASGGYEFSEVKQAGGFAEDKDGLRIMVTARISVLKQER